MQRLKQIFPIAVFVAVAIAASALLFAASPRQNTLITVSAGTPIQIRTQPTMAVEVFIQMASGGSGLGYVMAGVPPGVTPSSSNGQQVTAELAPSTATAPGGVYGDSPVGGVDVSQIWVDGTNSGDKIRVSYLLRN